MINYCGKQAWKNTQLLGFSVKTREEFDRVIGLGINLVEIRVDKFYTAGTNFYQLKDGKFDWNECAYYHLLGRLNKAGRGNTVVNFHLPIEKRICGGHELGLNMSVLEHHDILLQKFIMLEEAFAATGVGEILIVHPPIIPPGGEGKALKNAKIFFDRLDVIRLENGHSTKIGLENMTDPKYKTANLGNKPAHFKAMLKDTRTIGLTVDTGHRMLAKDYSMRGALKLGIPMVNFHFHGNKGVFNPKNWKDDQHLLPTKESGNLGEKAYKNFLRFFRRHRTPIILEIAHLEKYTDSELSEFVENLKKELE